VLNYISEAESRPTASDDVELKTAVTGSTRNVEQPVGASCLPAGSTTDAVVEIQDHRHEERMSAYYTGDYDEIVDTDGPEEEQATSGDNAEEEAASEYAELDPVAVAEHRARPSPVYEGLGRRRTVAK